MLTNDDIFNKNGFNEKKYDEITEDGDAKSLALFNDIKIKGRLIILFLNPVSGSQEGNIILDIISQYRIKSSPTIKIVKFPIDSHQSFIEIDAEDEIISTEQIRYSTLFDQNKHFSVAAFNIFDREEYENGIQFILSHLASSSILTIHN